MATESYTTTWDLTFAAPPMHVVSAATAIKPKGFRPKNLMVASTLPHQTSSPSMVDDGT
ncbi:hypothetical protein GYB14_12800 [bacterium]|nr:hypothetical protein [bacterium]